MRIDDGEHDTTVYKTPAIALDKTGAIYTSFIDATSGIDDVYLDSSVNQGNSFQQDIAIGSAPSGTLQQLPQIAVNQDGSILSCLWQDNRNGNWDIYIRNFKTQTPIDWLKVQQGDFGFLDSFQDDAKEEAKAYDQALAVIAFTSANETECAKKVLDALSHKQNPDGSWYCSYNPRTGENTDTEYSKYTGVLSWIIIAVNFYTHATLDTSYLDNAVSAAEWLCQFFDNDPESPTYGSFTGGLLGVAPIVWRSTEHNLEVYSAFKYLQKLLNENNRTSPRNYNNIADLTRSYLLNKVWDGERFQTGYQDDSRYLDPQTLAILSLGIRPDNYDIRPALNWASDNFTLQVDWDDKIKGITGLDEMVYYNQPPDKIWAEGTEQMVSAYNLIGKVNKASYLHKQIQRLQQANLGIPYSTKGTQQWPRQLAVSSTCWFYFNQRLPIVNPLDPASINESILTVDDFNDTLPNQNSLGFYTDDDRTCAVDEDKAGAHHIVWNDNNSYWYSVFFDGATICADISRFKYLSFRIKSANPGSDFIVRLEDTEKRTDISIKEYVETKAIWQCVNIPILDFVLKDFDASCAKSIAFVFAKDAQGDIYIDDLKFSHQRLIPFVKITTPENIYCLIPAQFDSSQSLDYDGGIVFYEWAFGDGVLSNEANPAHIYLTPGVYVVSLKVKDNDGLIAQADKVITVHAAPLVTDDLSFISQENNDLIYTDDVVLISAVTEAVEGEHLEHRFKIDGQIVQDYGPSQTYQWDTSSISIGRHLVEYDVRDEYGNTSHRQAYVYVYRRPIAPPG